jgi:hypothetical protein
MPAAEPLEFVSRAVELPRRGDLSRRGGSPARLHGDARPAYGRGSRLGFGLDRWLLPARAICVGVDDRVP